MVSLVDALVIQKTKGTTKIEKIDAFINWKRFGYHGTWGKQAFSLDHMFGF